MDLEWNQSPTGKLGEVKGLPFEIIEIGAVKLDKNFKEVDTFSQLIHPQIYQQINVITESLINISSKDLEGKDDFSVVIEKFIAWCGQDFIFATWGNMDLLELQRNLKYFNIANFLPKPLLYYNVQKLFALTYFDNQIPRTLQYAVEYLDIVVKEKFHRAFIDAKYTAKVFQKIDIKIIKNNVSIDYFCNPKTKTEEIEIINDKDTKFISREYSSRQSILCSREILAIKCLKCKKDIIKKVKWFTTNSKTYYCLGYCKQHGYVRGKLRIKKTEEGKYYVIKITKYITTEDARSIIQNYNQLKEKKKKKIESSK